MIKIHFYLSRFPQDIKDQIFLIIYQKISFTYHIFPYVYQEIEVVKLKATSRWEEVLYICLSKNPALLFGRDDLQKERTRYGIQHTKTCKQTNKYNYDSKSI